MGRDRASLQGLRDVPANIQRRRASCPVEVCSGGGEKCRGPMDEELQVLGSLLKASLSRLQV